MKKYNAIIQNQIGDFVFSHQRLVVINLINKGINTNFTEEQLKEAIDEVDMMVEIQPYIEIEPDITIEDIFLEFN